MDIKETLNEMLVNNFHKVQELEKNALATDEFSNISFNDMHIIEAIGLGDDSKMGEVAKRLNITVGALTTSMNALVHKGYVARRRSDHDRRVVNVYLLDKGKAVYHHHEKFHEKMIDSIMEELNPEQLEVLAITLKKLMNYFESFDTSQDL